MSVNEVIQQAIELKPFEKQILMESLWEDMMRSNDSESLTPDWHLDELRNREYKLSSANTSFLDLADVKKELQTLIK